jgi:hypothetical protein
MTGCQAHKNLGSFLGLLDLRDWKLTEGWCVAALWRPRLRSFDHCSNRLRVEWLAVLVAVTGIFQPGADFPIAEAAGFAFRPPEATGFRA